MLHPCTNGCSTTSVGSAKMQGHRVSCLAADLHDFLQILNLQVACFDSDLNVPLAPIAQNFVRLSRCAGVHNTE